MSFSLDTLADLTPTYSNKGFETPIHRHSNVLKRQSLTKKARSKYLSNGLAIRLCKIENSPLIKSYWNTWYCCSAMEQKDNKLTSRYCGNRWCQTCNRIRTAKMINGYSEAIESIRNPYFVTLTIPNEKGENLRFSILEMIRKIRAIKKRLLKQGLDITGIRKLECTYNKNRNDFHPHFHLLISGKVNSMILVNEWLKEFPTANRKGQDYRRADGKAKKELFKYFTKIITKVGTKYSIELKPLDIIFTAMRNCRVFQPMGLVKKQTEFDRFVNSIKATYTPRKKNVEFNLQDDEDIKVTAIFTATIQVNENKNYEKITPEEKNKLKNKFNEYSESFEIQKRKILFFDLFDIEEKKYIEKDLCYEINFVGVNLPDIFKKNKYRSFSKIDCAEWFKKFYKDLAGINISEDLEQLFSQDIEGLPEGNNNWTWQGNDWISLDGEILTNYMPTDEYKRIFSSIKEYKEMLTKEKAIIELKNNENFFNEKTFFNYRSVGKIKEEIILSSNNDIIPF